MTTPDNETFGCDRCWPASPDAAWESTRLHKAQATLIDESHFHVRISACPACAQNFVSVFTETIDWADGDDPQYWIVLPLTRPEADVLAARKEPPTEEFLSAIGPHRRCLMRDYPKGGSPATHWGTGLSIRWHD